tara:strand:- start:384 stop:977 length:594 start_codon:yes stop_codon:yes gene_type:complete
MFEKSAIVILAAGNSSRLGSPKQLLEVNGEKLLTHVVGQACSSKADDVYVVLGSGADVLSSLITTNEVKMIINEDWDKGMGSSIKKGIDEIQKQGIYDAVIVSVSDQPFLTSGVFNRLLAQTGDQEIVASAYSDGNFGPPTLFRKSMFSLLLKIADGVGAKSVIKNYCGAIGLVPFEKGDIDLDTKEDYNAFLGSSK